MSQTKSIQQLIRATAGELAYRVALLEVEFADILVIGEQHQDVTDRLQEKWLNATIQQTQPDTLSAARLADHQTDATARAEGEFKLPFESDSFNLVVSNLAVTFYPPDEFARECLRVLKDMGVLMVAAFGPGSFEQFEQACKHLEDVNFTAKFVDMCDFADLIYSIGDFVNPVVDTVYKEFSYGNMNSLIDDLHSSGFSPKLVNNPEHLDREAVRTKLLEHYPGVQDHADEIPLEIGLYYAIAWKYVDGSDSMPVPFTVH